MTRDAAAMDAAAMPPVDAGPPKPPVTFDPPGRGFSSPFMLTLTAGILIYLLVNNHYEVQFVYEVTSRSSRVIGS